MNKIKIKGEYIKLDALLKFSGICATGGAAKILIGSGLVLVNGEPCLQRGKKLCGGDTVFLPGGEGKSFLVETEE